jgi:hypothetical protein
MEYTPIDTDESKANKWQMLWDFTEELNQVIKKETSLRMFKYYTDNIYILSVFILWIIYIFINIYLYMYLCIFIFIIYIMCSTNI